MEPTLVTPRSTDERRLLSWSDVARRIPLSRTTIWHLRRTGAFPEPTRISDRRIAWPEDEINAWIEARHANDLQGAV
ncbi:MAG: AlpA family phage regulatory protein [Acidobacteriota bacterium]|nr:AlpA family phage regulatory protein [Acidobacteriota bacterium]